MKKALLALIMLSTFAVSVLPTFAQNLEGCVFEYQFLMDEGRFNEIQALSAALPYLQDSTEAELRLEELESTILPYCPAIATQLWNDGQRQSALDLMSEVQPGTTQLYRDYLTMKLIVDGDLDSATAEAEAYGMFELNFVSLGGEIAYTVDGQPANNRLMFAMWGANLDTEFSLDLINEAREAGFRSYAELRISYIIEGTIRSQFNRDAEEGLRLLNLAIEMGWNAPQSTYLTALVNAGQDELAIAFVEGQLIDLDPSVDESCEMFDRLGNPSCFNQDVIHNAVLYIQLAGLYVGTVGGQALIDQMYLEAAALYLSLPESYDTSVIAAWTSIIRAMPNAFVERLDLILERIPENNIRWAYVAYADMIVPMTMYDIPMDGRVEGLLEVLQQYTDVKLQ